MGTMKLLKQELKTNMTAVERGQSRVTNKRNKAHKTSKGIFQEKSTAKF